MTLSRRARERRTTSLSIVLSGDEPPTEFRIFTAGTVDTVKGAFTFDADAAKAVMVEYQAHGIDLPIDYDHAMLGGTAADPALAGRAAGWFCLELRNGELWAVNVRWTPSAAAALKAREWRFMSPAFQTDGDRIASVMNVAITNLPATRNLDPLMAASIAALGAQGMDPKLIAQALDALIAGDAEKCMELLKGLVAAAAGSDPDAATEDAPPPVGDGGADEAQEMGGPQAEYTPPKEDKQQVAAAITSLTRLTGKTTLGAVVEEVEAWRQKALKHDAVVEQAAKDKAVLELGKRKENAIALTKLGAETPHTTGLGLKTPKLCKRLLEEPLDEQTARVAALLAAKGGKLPPTPPTGADGTAPDGSREFVTKHGTVRLTKSELDACESAKAKPEVYAANKAIREKAREQVRS